MACHLAKAAMLSTWLTAWSATRPACYRQRHQPSPQLNFLDDYKAEVELLDCPPAVNPHSEQFIGEVNCERMEELRQVARAKGSEDGVDWAVEELASVELTAVDDRGMLLNEVLCSATDQRCIAVSVAVPWPSELPAQQLPEMHTAFTAISRRAYAAALDIEDALPPEYQMQQAELDGLMSLMNADFGKLLRFYALKHAREALSPTEQVEQARMTQLTFEGLSLELTTLDGGGYSLDFGSGGEGGDAVRRLRMLTGRRRRGAAA